jgi:hypothetical protein
MQWGWLLAKARIDLHLWRRHHGQKLELADPFAMHGAPTSASYLENCVMGIFLVMHATAMIGRKRQWLRSKSPNSSRMMSVAALHVWAHMATCWLKGVDQSGLLLFGLSVMGCADLWCE